jgi:hypothetical protein
MTIIKDALNRYVAETKRQWKHDRSATIGASEIGTCARRVWFVKHGAEVDPDHVERWGAMERGNLIETLWTKALRRYVGRGHLHYGGRYQKTFIDTESPLSATPDGVVHDPDRFCFVADCKSVDPRASLAEAKSEHIMQLQVQMGLVRAQTDYRPDYGILSYIDASFLDEVKEFVIKFSPAVFAQARLRATTIMQANSAEALRPEGYIAGGAECEYCAYRHSCSAMRAGQVPGREERLDPDAMQAVAGFAHQAIALERQADELVLQAKQHKESIKELLRQAGTRRAEAMGVRVTWASLRGRPAWDMPALRAAAEAAGLDLSEFERVGEPSDRLTISLKEPLEAAAE